MWASTAKTCRKSRIGAGPTRLRPPPRSIEVLSRASLPGGYGQQHPDAQCRVVQSQRSLWNYEAGLESSELFRAGHVWDGLPAAPPRHDCPQGRPTLGQPADLSAPRYPDERALSNPSRATALATTKPC